MTKRCMVRISPHSPFQVMKFINRKECDTSKHGRFIAKGQIVVFDAYFITEILKNFSSMNRSFFFRILKPYNRQKELISESSKGENQEVETSEPLDISNAVLLYDFKLNANSRD